MIKKTIRLAIYLSVSTMILIVIKSCDCACTEVGCISDSRPFVFKFSNDHFSEQDLDEILMIRTDKSFIGIDTAQIGNYLNKNDFSIDFFYIGNLYNDDYEIKDFNYLIVLNSINQIDSVWNVDYDVEMISEVCNTCSGGINCEDEYYDYKKYTNPSFKINGQEQTGFEILIERR